MVEYGGTLREPRASAVSTLRGQSPLNYPAPPAWRPSGEPEADVISRGFLGRRRPAEVEKRLPPGQYLVTDFPVLSAGPTPHTPLDRWSFTLEGLVRSPVSWNWDEFLKLPSQTFTVDISCVTKWTKLDTKWLGVSVDTLLQSVQVDGPARYCHGLQRWWVHHERSAR